MHGSGARGGSCGGPPEDGSSRRWREGAKRRSWQPHAGSLEAESGAREARPPARPPASPGAPSGAAIGRHVAPRSPPRGLRRNCPASGRPGERAAPTVRGGRPGTSESSLPNCAPSVVLGRRISACVCASSCSLLWTPPRVFPAAGRAVGLEPPTTTTAAAAAAAVASSPCHATVVDYPSVKRVPTQPARPRVCSHGPHWIVASLSCDDARRALLG